MSDADKKTEQLKKDNEYLSYKLHELKIGASGNDLDQEDEAKKFADDEEIMDMRRKLN